MTVLNHFIEIWRDNLFLSTKTPHKINIFKQTAVHWNRTKPGFAFVKGNKANKHLNGFDPLIVELTLLYWINTTTLNTVSQLCCRVNVKKDMAVASCVHNLSKHDNMNTQRLSVSHIRSVFAVASGTATWAWIEVGEQQIRMWKIRVIKVFIRLFMQTVIRGSHFSERRGRKLSSIVRSTEDRCDAVSHDSVTVPFVDRDFSVEHWLDYVQNKLHFKPVLAHITGRLLGCNFYLEDYISK